MENAVGSSAACTPQTNTVGITTSRVQCREIELLGMTTNNSIHVCVHQLSVELWKRYDTPRAAVQKKLESLKCEVEFCTKEQIHELREKGIVENHRATNISLQDGELLYDALEASRRKRGLEKHKLKSKDRNMRKEEVKIRKTALLRDLRESRQYAAIGEGALNRSKLQQIGKGDRADKSLQEDTTLEIFPGDPDLSYTKDAGTLLVTEESIELPGDADWEFMITRVPNAAYIATPPATQLMDGSIIDSSDSEPLNDRCSYIQSVSGASGNTPLYPCPTNLHIHSPSLVSTSDIDDRASHHSLSTSSTRSHSNATTPTKSSPERFLFMDSDESDNEGTVTATPQTPQYRGITHKGKQLREFAEPSIANDSGATKCSSIPQPGERSIPPSVTSTSYAGSKHRSVTATKLLHYAKTTSPSAMTSLNEQSPQKTDSLIVSIPLFSLPTSSDTSSKISSTKPRVLTPLSKFAMKKRALSRSPSLSSNYDDMSPTSSGIPATLPNGGGMRGGKVSVSSKGGWKVGRPPKKSGKVKSKPPVHIECSSDSPISIEPSSTTDNTTEVLRVGRSDNQEDLLSEDHCGLDLTRNNTTALPEDDVISITSTTTSSTNSATHPKTTKSQQHTQSRGGKRASRGSHSNSSNNNLLRIDSNFSLESLFSYCPPTLTIRNGELVPEKSLSIKNVDQSSLPPSHPIHNWSLGQPVRSTWMGGTNGTAHRQRKPRKNTGRPSNNNTII